ncbi:MAG: ROK family protein [Anaerolineales bacterium]|nr:ROK family protein [Anaerolineales bacterium]
MTSETYVPLFGGIEGGGTKFVCAVGSGPDDIRAETRFPTTTPAETMERAVAFFKDQERVHGALVALGFGSFGPIDPRPGSPTFGHILLTPKAGWSHADVVGPLRSAFHVPIGFDLDVNAAALSEGRWGAGQNCDPLMYITIGTGIGAGLLVHGRLVHGLLHPEAGHLPLPHDRARDPFAGNCPFHGDCFEGLASGPAIEKRWGQKAETLPPEHPAWELEAEYIALALCSYIYTLSPQRIVLGGGVSQQPQVLQKVREKVPALLNRYIQSTAILERIEEYIVLPGLGNRAGVLGALALAEQAWRNQTLNG